mgnify:CR=1 FL=1
MLWVPFAYCPSNDNPNSMIFVLSTFASDNLLWNMVSLPCRKESAHGCFGIGFIIVLRIGLRHWIFLKNFYLSLLDIICGRVSPRPDYCGWINWEFLLIPLQPFVESVQQTPNKSNCLLLHVGFSNLMRGSLTHPGWFALGQLDDIHSPCSLFVTDVTRGARILCCHYWPTQRVEHLNH